MKNILLALVALLALSGAGCNVARSESRVATTTTIIPSAAAAQTKLPTGTIMIYVGQGCPHCAIVESRVKNTRMDSALPIVFKEVFNDQANAQEMYDVARGCGIPAYDLGVPLLWDGVRCVRNDPDILDYLGARLQAAVKK